MKKFKAIVCAAVSLCMIAVPLSSSIVFNAGAEDKPKTIQEKISELNEKSEEFQKILDQTETDIDEAEKYGDALLEKIKVINEKIVLMNQSISKLEEEAEKSNEEVDLQIDALCKRLRTIYMAGSASNLEIVLGAKSFDDFIDKMALVKNLSAYDNKLINEIDDKLEEIKEKKEEIQTQKDALQNELDELNRLVEENDAVLKDLTAKSKEAKALMDEVGSKKAQLEAEAAAQFAQQEAARKALTEAQQQAAKQQAAALQKQQAQQQAQQQQQQQSQQPTQQSTTEAPSYDDDDDDDSGSSGSGGSSDPIYYDPTPAGGGYLWPCPGFYYLSSLWNEDRYTYNHGAIDIAGGGILGTPVVAAADGYVEDTCTYCSHNYGKSGSCGCGGGYGNYVWMSHGNGKETIYAHLTSVCVSPGESVSQGQVIGYVGTTGYSTGPHLHFECRYNGVKYNPMNELSGYWGMVSY